MSDDATDRRRSIKVRLCCSCSNPTGRHSQCLAAAVAAAAGNDAARST